MRLLYLCGIDTFCVPLWRKEEKGFPGLTCLYNYFDSPLFSLNLNRISDRKVSEDGPDKYAEWCTPMSLESEGC